MSTPLPDFLFFVSLRTAGESEKPGHIDISVFVEVTDQARVKVAQLGEWQLTFVHLPGL
jgi:hypothetical protein